MTINIILMAAYGVWLFSEIHHLSGIVALCVLGIWLKKEDDHNNNMKVTYALHGMIDYIGWFMETAIFITSGLFLGENFKYDYDSFFIIIPFFFCTILVRFICVMLCYPLIGWKGRYEDGKAHFREYVFLALCGLKGSHGLILSLVIAHEAEFYNESFSK